MCRWLGYTGSPVLIEDVQIESPLFLAHVRATSLATVQETNCHPFRHGRWLFVHNGEIHEIEKYRRDLLLRVDERYFENIQGTTDSEVMFHLALTFGLESDPLGGIARMTGFVESVARAHGVEESVGMTLGVTDGTTLYAVRYVSDGEAPTLYHSKDMGDLISLNPRLEGGYSRRRLGSSYRSRLARWRAPGSRFRRRRRSRSAAARSRGARSGRRRRNRPESRVSAALIGLRSSGTMDSSENRGSPDPP